MLRDFLYRHRLFLINLTSASGLLAAGDLFVQVYYEEKKTLDKKRLLAALTTGAMLGIEGHVWYSFLDRKIAQPTWRNVLKKLLLDQTVAAPVYTLTYIVGTSALEGRTSYHQLINDIQTNLIPLYLMDCLIFSPVQIFNFKYIPSSYRVPFLTLCAFGFDVFMSAYKHKYEGIHVHNNQK